MQLDLYSNDDYRELPVFNLIDFARLFVHPEPLDHATLVQNLRAGLRVAEGLDHAVPAPPEPWPNSFAFPHYAREVRGDDELVRLIEACPSMEEIRAAVAAVQHFAAQNDLTNPNDTPRGIRGLLTAEKQNLESLEGGDKVDISFLPTGVERMLLLIASPLALTFLGHLFLGQYRRRRAILAQLVRTRPRSDLALREYPWLLSNLDLEGSVAANGSVLRALLVVGLGAPLACQGSIAAFAWTNLQADTGRWLVLVLTSVCLVLSSWATWHVVRDRMRWTHATPRRDSDGEGSLEPPATDQTEGDRAGSYVGTLQGRCFHLPTCARVDGLDGLIAWSSRELASRDRRACRVCSP